MKDKSLKIILTGATGFVGEGILQECLNNAAVTEILMVNRKHLDLYHTKLSELIVPDFMNLESVTEKLSGFDACFFCAGISSAGMNEKKYTHITYDTTIHFANVLVTINPELVFNFISGSHTDSSEKGKIMWARVKGKTENALMKLPFKGQFNFRPGAMIPFDGQKNVKPFYRAIVKTIAYFMPKKAVTLQELGLSMIHTVQNGYPIQVLEIKDIIKSAGMRS